MKVLGQSVPIHEAVKKRGTFSEWTCEFMCKENNKQEQPAIETKEMPFKS